MCLHGASYVKMGHYSVKIVRMISKYKYDQYFMMLLSSFNYLQKLFFRNQKCDPVDDADGVIIPTCRPLFAGDTIRL